MTRILGRTAGLALALGLVAGPAAAQMLGNPVYFSPKGGTGLTISGDYGRGVNDESGKTDYFGGRATLGLPMVSISAGAGSVSAEGADSEIGFGGALAVNILKAPLLPVAVNLQGGVGYLKEGDPTTLEATTLNVPVGVGIAINVPSPAVSVEPWAAPRVNIQRVEVTSGTGSASDTEVGFGASAGVNVGLPMGLGFHVAADWMTVGDPAVKPLYIGVGAHYKFTIPGLGVVGM